MQVSFGVPYLQYNAGAATMTAINVNSKNPEAANDPNHPAWEDASVFWWNEPLFGYYQNLDRYVLRKHAELLADAGVDVIIFDCTNAIRISRKLHRAFESV